MTLDGWLRQDAAVPRLDRELLLMHQLKTDRAGLIRRAADPLTAAQLKDLDAGSARLAAGEPLAYITGARGFWDFTVTVTPAVLIPRPETETLVEAALERLSPGETALDLGTGSGAIAIALARSGGAAVTAVDASADALVVARNNAERLGAEIQFLE
ncbi:MAG: HemK/PrmC family methyltransferase, partial [Pseudomonadota bacterium]